MCLIDFLFVLENFSDSKSKILKFLKNQKNNKLICQIIILFITSKEIVIF